MGTFSLIVIYWPYLLLNGRPVVNFNKKLILFWLVRNAGAISQRYTAFKLQFCVCIEGISVFSPDVVFMMNRLEKGTITVCGQYTEASENDFYQHWSSLKASRRSIEANEIIRFFFYEKQGHAVSGPYRWKVTFTNHKIISRISVYDLFHQSIFPAFFFHSLHSMTLFYWIWNICFMT